MQTFKYLVATAAGLAIEPGAAILLTAQQLKLRRHQVESVGPDGSGAFVSPRDRLQFKRGEIVELAVELPKALVARGIVEQLGGEGLPLPKPAASTPTPSAQPGQRRGRGK